VGGTIFLLEIAFEYDKALVRKNWSDSDGIKVGGGDFKYKWDGYARNSLKKISPGICRMHIF